MSSSSSLTLTQKWLKQNTTFYSNPDRVYADADAILNSYSTLRPKTDVYTYDDGRTQLLLCLHGLLPITFRNAGYNIPVAIWITLNHPREPPIVYVIPTNDMLVKAGKAVDLSGRCELDYMSHWRRKPEVCSLAGLLEAMQDQFSRDPPVYAKPRNTREQASPTPARSTAGTSSHVTSPATDSAVQPPHLPPKPHAQVATHLHSIASGSVVGSPVISSSSPAASTPVQSGAVSTVLSPNSAVSTTASPPPPPRPPVPPHPRNIAPSIGPGPPPYVAAHNHQWIGAPHQQQTQPPIPPLHTPIGASNYSHPVPRPAPPLPQTTPTLAPPTSPPLHHNPGQTVAPIPLAQPRPHPQPPRPTTFVPYPVSLPTMHRQAGHANPQAQNLSSQIVSPRPPPSIPPPDLLDEDDVPETATSTVASAATAAAAPPRPPNPELMRIQSQLLQKLQEALTAMSASVAETTARQQAIQRDLLAGGPAIRDEMGRLVAVRDVCRAVSERMREVVRNGEGNLVELRRKGEPEVDELVCSTTIVHNQLINLIAEDNAIEDTLYHLHRALNSGRIDLERFLRTTRVLAEEQFMKRALVEKILNGIPMGMSVS